MITKSDILQELWLAYAAYEVQKPAPANAIKDVEDSVKALGQDLEKYAADEKFTPESSSRYKALQTSWQSLQSDFQKTLIELKQASTPKEKLGTELNQYGDRLLSLNDQLTEILDSIRKANGDVAIASAAKEKINSIGLWSTFLLTTLLGIALVFLAKGLTKQLRGYSHSISSVVKKASELADSLSGASGSLASSTQEQAAAIQESVSALSEMSSMISQTGQSVQHSLESSREATAEAIEGKKTIELLSGAIMAIQKANDQMQEILAIIHNIGEKTSVINDIVFKTQLLSFNASIEAARAGAHGRGFSVVAEEVSNLAELSGEAAKEIDVLLHGSQTKVKETLEQIHVRVTDTVKTNRMVQQSFESISGLVVKVEQQLKSIGEASKQQELGIQQTNAAMRQMEASAEENRSSSEKTHRASEDLSKESGSLAKLSEELELFVGGGKVFVQAAAKATSKEPHSAEIKAFDLESLVGNIATLNAGAAPTNSESANREQYFKKVA